MSAQPQPSEGVFAPPRQVHDPSTCWFYHTMDLPEVGIVRGQWDLRGGIDGYLGNVDFRGKRTLDVGTASGFLTFAMEARGGEVVSFDMGAEQEWNLVPFAWRDGIRAAQVNELRAGLERMKNGYWLAHRLLRSRARACYGDVYAIPPALGQFDVVVVAQILVHLRDPVGALTSAASRSDDYLIVTEGAMRTLLPIAYFYPQPGRVDADKTWWRYSVGLYRRLLRIVGFEVERVSHGRYTCMIDGAPTRKPVTTIVARRTVAPVPMPSRNLLARALRLLGRD